MLPPRCYFTDIVPKSSGTSCDGVSLDARHSLWSLLPGTRRDTHAQGTLDDPGVRSVKPIACLHSYGDLPLEERQRDAS